MTTSLSCRVSATSAFCWPTTQTPSITNSLVTIIHKKPVIAILVPKLAAMAMSLRCKVSAISRFCRPTTQTPSITNCLVTIIHTKPVIAILVPKLVAMATSLSTSGLLSNTWFYKPTPSPQPKWHLDRFSCFCRAH